MKINYKHTKYACYFAYTTSAVINNLAPLLFVTFQTGFGITLEQLALLITANFGLQIIVDFIGAGYAEKIGYRTTIVAAQIFSAAGLLLMSILPYLINPFAGLIISVLVYAIGSGLNEVMVSPIVEALPGDEKAGAMSILHSFYCWGHVFVILASTLFFNIIGIDSWRWLCRLWALLPAVTAVLFTLVPIRVFGEEESSVPLKKLFRQGIFGLFLLLMLCAGAAEQAMSQWVSYFAEAGLQISKTAGDLIGTCMFAVMMGLSRLIYGKVSTRLNMSAALLASSALCIVGYLLAGLAANPFVSLIGCVLCGFSVGIMWPGTLSLAASSCAGAGTALFGFLAMGGDMGCFAGPQLIAAVSSRFASGMKAGMLCSVIFPIAIICGIFALTHLLKKQHSRR